MQDPIKFWHHQHFFKAAGSNTDMTDIVHYATGYGIPGELMHRFIVRPRLDSIFEYRYETLTRLFPEMSG